MLNPKLSLRVNNNNLSFLRYSSSSSIAQGGFSSRSIFATRQDKYISQKKINKIKQIRPDELTNRRADYSLRFHGTEIDESTAQKVFLTFVDKDGTKHRVPGFVGQTVLEVAHNNEINIEGACEGSLACSTCHVIVEPAESFKRMPPPSEREEDLLDLAPGLKETSRLCCQLIVTPDFENAQFVLPPSTLNFYVDGHVPKPH